MSEPILRAVVEVDEAQRVRCQAEGCARPVFREIHVVEQDGAFHVYGSECCRRLFGWTGADRAASFTNAGGRPLTQEERDLLLENTRALIARFEQEHRAHLEEARAKRPQIDVTPAWKRPPSRHRPLTMSADLERRAKAAVRQKYGVNPDLPGWRMTVLAEARKLDDDDRERGA